MYRFQDTEKYPHYFAHKETRTQGGHVTLSQVWNLFFHLRGKGFLHLIKENLLVRQFLAASMLNRLIVCGLVFVSGLDVGSNVHQ